MTETPATVYIVDDDEPVRDALALLMESASLPARSFDSAQAFIDNYQPGQAGCLLLDIRMSGMSGLQLRDWLDDHNATLPIIFITGHGDVAMAVDAMKRGAIDFLQKPFSDETLLERVRQALADNAHRRAEIVLLSRLKTLYDSLTPREREIMDIVVAGKANKVIAQDLAISQRTVEIHRARVMQKMKARSIADLVRYASLIEE